MLPIRMICLIGLMSALYTESFAVVATRYSGQASAVCGTTTYNGISVNQIRVVHQGGPNSNNIPNACGLHSLFNALQFLVRGSAKDAFAVVQNVELLNSFLSFLNEHAAQYVRPQGCHSDEIRALVSEYCGHSCEKAASWQEAVTGILVVDNVVCIMPGYENFLTTSDQIVVEEFRTGKRNMIGCVIHTGGFHWIAVVCDRQNKIVYLMDSMDSSGGLIRSKRVRVLWERLINSFFFGR